MAFSVVRIVVALFLFISSASEPDSINRLGKFDIKNDLYLAHFDSKTDVDDLHSIAGIATMLADPRFADVQYHAVAGAYGIQEGLYVPANELFNLAFGENWSDAHSNFDQSVAEVSAISLNILKAGGAIWIADAGQSNFSAALIRTIISNSEWTEDNLKNKIHIVQHSDWNESVTASDDLSFVQENISYHKIPDGNAVGNGSPGFRSENKINWGNYNLGSDLTQVWDMAIEIANKYNGVDGRYNNEAIARGGFDFSDVSETAWIFGFQELNDVKDFFTEFSS